MRDTEIRSEDKAKRIQRELLIQEDSFGKYVIIDDQRIPVRNGGPLRGISPTKDWQCAREVEQDIESGSGVSAPAFSAKSLFNAVWSVSASTGGWTTYKMTPEWNVAAWVASLPTVWAPYGAWLSFEVSHLDVLSMLLVISAGWVGPFSLWSGWINKFGESDASLARSATS